MKWTKWALALCLGSSTLHAKNPLEEWIEKYELKPLAESEYWKQNPGVLPYDECKLVSANGTRVHGHRHETLVGVSKYKEPFTLFCFSKKLKVGFQIPLDFRKEYSVGLAINWDLYHYASGHMRHLDAKNAQDLFGTYKGFSGGIGVGISVSGAILRHSGIAMTLNESGSATLVHVAASYRSLTLDSRRLIEGEIYSPYYLEKEAELREATHTPVSEIEDLDKFFAMVKDASTELNNWPDSKKFTSTFRYWIHHLKSRADIEQQCQLALARPYSHHEEQEISDCSLSAQHLAHVDIRKLRGTLDPDFLARLQFKKIR